MTDNFIDNRVNVFEENAIALLDIISVKKITFSFQFTIKKKNFFLFINVKNLVDDFADNFMKLFGEITIVMCEFLRKNETCDPFLYRLLIKWYDLLDQIPEIQRFDVFQSIEVDKL